MHIKYYPTYLENIELKKDQMKDSKILLRIVRRTYNNIRSILKKQFKIIQIKDSNA
jgi:hypothetical protein